MEYGIKSTFTKKELDEIGYALRNWIEVLKNKANRYPENKELYEKKIERAIEAHEKVKKIETMPW